MGRMVQIDDLLKELTETRKQFGNTCVYIRDMSWGAVALNRQADDERAEKQDLQKDEELHEVEAKA